jgi:hypothetical protein
MLGRAPLGIRARRPRPELVDERFSLGKSVDPACIRRDVPHIVPMPG